MLAVSKAATLNNGLLPDDYYALPEQHAAGFGPDVLTLQGTSGGGDDGGTSAQFSGGGAGLLLGPPRVRLAAEADLEFYRRKQNVVAVRHVSGDHLVAIVEIVSKGNKSGRKAFEDFVRKDPGQYLWVHRRWKTRPKGEAPEAYD